MMMLDPTGRPRRPITEDQSVKLARNRFKNVLKHMVQDNFLQEEESDSENDENRMYDHKLGNVRLGGYRFGTPSKKRKHSGSPSDVPAKPQASFVMKLFDRGVDLAQFDESTPLYPICRAWMQNKPHQRQPRRDEDAESNLSELEYQGETEEVYRLTPPEPLPFDEYGNLIRVRVPPPLPREDDAFDINYEDDNVPSPAYLFQTHLDRWNLIRQRWKEASAYNEKRFDSSFNVLRQIHDRVTHQQEQQRQQMQNAQAQQEMQQQQQQQQQ